jgi:hypothetical protein
MENVYGLDPQQVSVSSNDKHIKIVTNSLQFAGGQKFCPGHIEANLWKVHGNLRLKVNAKCKKVIKSITILVRGLSDPIDSYKEQVYSWPDVITYNIPFVKTIDGETFSFMPTTTRPRFRKWSVYQDFSGYYVFNLTEDEEYTNRKQHMEGSEWILFHNEDKKHLESLWYKMLENERGLSSWESRVDVPTWFREVSLVLNMHCEGWTGFVFNSFDRQLEILQWIAELIDGRHVLVYMPGWDGRYYWNYPIYEPSEACGGRNGLTNLVEEAHELNMHVIPMFSLMASNYRKTKELQLQKAICRNSYDIEELRDGTEWDEDLSNDTIWLSLNVGEPNFRKYLFDRICWVTDTFKTDGIMLDISGWIPKDPRYNLLKGLERLIKRLHKRYKEYLIFGENGSDIHLPLFPLFHHAYNLDEHHPFFRYCRSAYHLHIGAPGKGSTGVHEAGIKPYFRVSAANPAIPTLSIVNDTLPKHSEEVKSVIKVAKDWSKRWN